MSVTLIVNITFYLSLSITLFDLDYKKSKRPSEPKTPDWIGLIYFVSIVTWIALILLNWKFAIIGIAVYYLSAFIPIPQIVGNFLVAPFKPKN